MSEAKPGSQAGGSPGILIVDDEEIVRSALRETLRRERYQVVTMSDPVAALGVVREQPFSVVITDQQMPGLTGLELLAQVKVMQPDATRILITAVLSLDTVIDAINKGEIYRFIVKPWLREELLATVRNAVQRYELTRSHARLQAETQAMNEQLLGLNRSLAEQVALGVRQNDELAALNRILADNLQRSVELCLHSMEAFHPTLGIQARRVYQVCKAMGETLGLPAEEQKALELSAWLHDSGLVSVPRRIIRAWEETPDRLTEPEWILIRNHPAVGQQLASFVHDLSAVGRTIRAHHERFDSRGYPDRLGGEEIPWLGRLLAVAVAYASCNEEGTQALETIKAGAGTAFDPRAVETFLRAFPKAAVARKARRVVLMELQPGMVLAQGIYAANGLLLLPEGAQLNSPFLEKLRRERDVAPVDQAFVVYC
jgi:response regulator RpfG family c-di-GMP phosphodiesterase